jgi:hypothetical protein
MERNQDCTSIYQSGSEGLRTLPSQHDLAMHHEVVEPVGQPTKDYESSEFYNVRIECSLAKYLRALGGDGDDIAKGIRIAAQFHQAMCKQAR